MNVIWVGVVPTLFCCIRPFTFSNIPFSDHRDPIHKLCILIHSSLLGGEVVKALEVDLCLKVGDVDVISCWFSCPDL